MSRSILYAHVINVNAHVTWADSINSIMLEKGSLTEYEIPFVRIQWKYIEMCLVGFG